MSPSRIVIVVVAGVAALLLAFLVHAMLGKPAPSPVVAATPAAPPMTRVLTARVDLTVGQRLSPDNMNWQPWPAATVNDAYVTDGSMTTPKAGDADVAVKRAGAMVTDIATGGGPKLQAMVGAIVKEPIYAGEPITARKIVRSGDSGYMAVRLPAGERAMSISVTVESGVAGFIQPGDRVDILSTHNDASKGSSGMAAQTVLANVKVLAVDQRTDTPKGAEATPGAATLTLEVPADDVEALVSAKAAGGLALALRSYADIGSASAGVGHGVRIFRGGGAAEMVTAQ